jgi:flavin-dependent dehydrogenase
VDATVPLEAGALTVVSRTAFDAALLAAASQAGARHCPVRVADVEADERGIRLRTSHGEHRADLLVGADGAASLVRRRVAGPFRRDQLSIATGVFARNVTSDQIVVELIADPPGYIWSFPRPDHLAVGICAQANAGLAVEALRERALAWIRATGIARGARLEPYSWPIPSLNRRDLGGPVLAGARWCLVGDAAGLVDPITREGIYFALVSAAWAAEAIVAGDLRRYPARARQDALPELVRAARFKSGFFRPAFSALLLDALQESRPIRAVMADLIAGRQSYRTLTWRLARTLEMRLAWRAFSARNNRPVREPARHAD